MFFWSVYIFKTEALIANFMFTITSLIPTDLEEGMFDIFLVELA